MKEDGINMIDVNKIPNTIARWDAAYSDRNSYIRNPENVRVNDIDHLADIKYGKVFRNTEFSKRLVKIYHRLFSLEERILLEKSDDIRHKAIRLLMKKITHDNFWLDPNHPVMKKLYQCERNYLTAHGVDCENFERRIAWLRMLEDLLYEWCKKHPDIKESIENAECLQDMLETGILRICFSFGPPADDRPGYYI